MLLMQVLLVFVPLAFDGESARILAYYPSPAHSHQAVFKALTQRFVERGDDLVVITPRPIFPKEKSPQNLREIDVRNISYSVLAKAAVFPKVMTGERNEVYGILRRTVKMLGDIVVEQLLNEEVQQLIRNQTNKFDLIVAEGYFFMALAFAHIYKAPILLVNSLGATRTNLQLAGSPRHPILHPEFFQRDVYNHTILERLDEFIHFHTVLSYDEDYSNRVVKSVFGAEAPTMEELRNLVVDNVLLLGVHPVWDMNRPVAKNVAFVSGLHLRPENDLPKDLQDYLDGSARGVVYVSFGTSIDAASFPPDKLGLLVETFRALPYDVLWKWNRDQPPGRGDNIKFAKWLPQADLLKHPKVKLFIYQGGLQSSDEAILAGVPMLGIPIIGDQWFNTRQVAAHGAGLRVELVDVTGPDLGRYIRMLIEDPKYRENVAKLRSILHDQPQSSLDRAIWWSQYITRHGARHLRPPAANMHWSQYFEIELVMYLLGLLLLFTVTVLCMIQYLYRKFTFYTSKWLSRLLLVLS